MTIWPFVEATVRLKLIALFVPDPLSNNLETSVLGLYVPLANKGKLLPLDRVIAAPPVYLFRLVETFSERFQAPVISVGRKV